MLSIITYSVVLFPMLVAFEEGLSYFSVSFASLVYLVSHFSWKSHLAEVLVHSGPHPVESALALK